MRERLTVSRSVTLDAAGSGLIQVGPTKYAEKWEISRMTTSGTGVLNPKLQIYRGAPGGRLMDTTVRGNNDVSETDAFELLSGEIISALYSGGSVGAIMSLHIEGEVKRGV